MLGTGAAWLGKREGVKLTEVAMEAAKASCTAQHSSELLSCDKSMDQITIKTPNH
jgi:hypothetical protein